MIPNRKGWHYLAVKKLSALLKQIIPKHVGIFYCSNCLHLFRTKSKLESHKHVCESKELCGVVPSQDTILGLNYKTASIIYADLESLIKRVDEYKNNFSGGTFSVFDMDI